VATFTALRSVLCKCQQQDFSKGIMANDIQCEKCRLFGCEHQHNGIEFQFWKAMRQLPPHRGDIYRHFEPDHRGITMRIGIPLPLWTAKLIMKVCAWRGRNQPQYVEPEID
jgi:hypothetical protein